MFDAYFTHPAAGLEHVVSGCITARDGALYIVHTAGVSRLCQPGWDIEVFRDGERQSCYRSENGEVVFMDCANWF